MYEQSTNQVLVHGEANEMGRLKAALIREYEDDPDCSLEVHNPRNTHAVELYFRGEKMAKVWTKCQICYCFTCPMHDFYTGSLYYLRLLASVNFGDPLLRNDKTKI